MIELTAFFEGKFCRVLSGQRYPDLSREDGVSQVVKALTSLLPFAETSGVTRLAHGVIGKGVYDYDAIFTILSEAGFHSWISIEDGLDGMDDLRESVRFLKSKIERYFSA